MLKQGFLPILVSHTTADSTEPLVVASPRIWPSGETYRKPSSESACDQHYQGCECQHSKLSGRKLSGPRHQRPRTASGSDLEDRDRGAQHKQLLRTKFEAEESSSLSSIPSELFKNNLTMGPIVKRKATEEPNTPSDAKRIKSSHEGTAEPEEKKPNIEHPIPFPEKVVLLENSQKSTDPSTAWGCRRTKW